MKTDISMFDSYQQDIILENSGKDIVVGASAGAGKTMVLVARILKRCMEDRISVDRILALTFTAAAAQEMKNRLGQRDMCYGNGTVVPVPMKSGLWRVGTF